MTEETLRALVERMPDNVLALSQWAIALANLQGPQPAVAPLGELRGRDDRSAVTANRDVTGSCAAVQKAARPCALIHVSGSLMS